MTPYESDDLTEVIERDGDKFVVLSSGSVQSFSHFRFGLSGARHWLKR
jgi:hypothetical protein